MDTKILFTDLDGTLLNDKKEITPGNQAAIDEALAQGHKIVIATGRPLTSAKVQAKRLGFTREGCYAITYNGGQIYDLFQENTLYGKPLPADVIPLIFQAAHDRDIHIQTYAGEDVICEQDNESVRSYCKINLLPYKVVEHVMDAMEELPYKMLAIHEDYAKLEAFRQEMLSIYGTQIDSFFSSGTYMEFVPVGVSKGFAVRWMCQYLGIPLENSVAAGDAQNDISMLKAAHVGAVMCNAYLGIAEHGNYVTKADNNHDGVAEIIRTFIL